MTDSTRAAREDLAFLRAVAEDRGPLPWSAGAHCLAIGGVFGANLMLAWAAQRFVPAEKLVSFWSWLPGAIVYLAAYFVIRSRAKAEVTGPSARMIGATWLAVQAMTLFIVLALLRAHAVTGVTYEAIWPVIAWALYGGAWVVAGVVKRQVWPGVIAAGCFAFVLVIASVLDKPSLLLVLGLAALWAFAAPGWMIMRQSKPAS